MIHTVLVRSLIFLWQLKLYHKKGLVKIMKDTINIKDFLNKAKNMKNGISNNVEMNKLGRGLSALLSDNNDLINKNNIIEDKLKILKINILEIEINKNQPRKFFEDDSLKELSISIAQKGILQPILVRKNKNNLFEIIAGERRFRAAKIANLKEVPCIVLDYSDLEVLEIALIENLHRKDLNAIEEANSFKKLSFRPIWSTARYSWFNRLFDGRCFAMDDRKSDSFGWRLHTKVIYEKLSNYRSEWFCQRNVRFGFGLLRITI
jgi:hypothetical protein